MSRRGKDSHPNYYQKKGSLPSTPPIMALGMITVIHAVLAVLVIIELGITGYRKPHHATASLQSCSFVFAANMPSSQWLIRQTTGSLTRRPPMHSCCSAQSGACSFSSTWPLRPSTLLASTTLLSPLACWSLRRFSGLQVPLLLPVSLARQHATEMAGARLMKLVLLLHSSCGLVSWRSPFLRA